MELSHVARDIPDMPAWLKTALFRSGITQRELTKQMSDLLGRMYDETAITKLKGGARKISFEEAVAISEILSQPLPLHKTGALTVAVIGAVREGGNVVEYKAPISFVEAPSDDDTEMVAYEVVGRNALSGIAYDGWLVYVEKQRRPLSQDDAGRSCVISFNDHPATHRIVEHIHPDGKADLRSVVTGEITPRASVSWVQRVLWIKPR